MEGVAIISPLGKLIGVAALPNYRLALSWDDGALAQLDLKAIIEGAQVLAPLLDPDEFAEVELHADRWSISWPSGVDFGATQLRRWAEEQGAVRLAHIAAE